MSKLTKAQEKRFEKKFPLKEVKFLGMNNHCMPKEFHGYYIVEKPKDVKQHLADEKAISRKEGYEAGYNDGIYKKEMQIRGFSLTKPK